MSDETTFRQERKKINPSEIDDGMKPSELAKVQAFHKEIGSMSEDIGPLSGHLPPQLEQLMRQQRQQQADMPMPDQAPSRSFTNDPALERLLSGLSTQRYEAVRLPSMGKFYSGPNLPSNGVIHLRPMTGQEEQILATQRHVRSGVAMNMIFKSCFQENIDVEKLLVIDRTHILIYLRGISYGVMYDVSLKCPECGSSFEHSINLNALVPRFCEENFNSDDLVGTMPQCGYTFKYRLPTAKDESDVNEYRERRAKQQPQAIDDTFVHRAALLIQSISDGAVEITNTMHIKSLLQRMVVADVNYVRNVLMDPPFGVQTEVPIICPSCLCEWEVELPMETSFFFPRRRREE